MRNSIGLFFIFCIHSAFAQDAQEKSPWYLPDHAGVQFAGNIGFFSAGAGYRFGDKLEADLILGFLPKKIGGDDILSLTGKATYLPWCIAVSDQFNIYPFSLGGYLSYSFGSQFDTLLPNEYPDGYYWWATSLRLGGSVGGQLEAVLTDRNSLALYYELTTYDLIFLSFIHNTHYLGIDDVISLALGIKFGF